MLHALGGHSPDDPPVQDPRKSPGYAGAGVFGSLAKVLVAGLLVVALLQRIF